MPQMAAASRGSSLSEFLDQVLEADVEAADWSRGITHLGAAGASLAFSPFARNPFERLEATLARLPTGMSPSLEVVGHTATQLLNSERLDDAIARATGRRPSGNARRIVVYHGESRARRSVLVLDPGRPETSLPEVLPSELIPGVLFQQDPQRPQRTLARLGLPPDLGVAAEFLAVARPRVVIAGAPQMEFVSTPAPAWRAQAGAATSTIGALVRDSSGRLGVTACHHGTGPVGTQVTLFNGEQELASEVALASPLLDTCFVPLSDSWRPSGLQGRGGVLDRRAPGQAEPHRFEGASRGARSTAIVGTDMGVPYPSPGRQLCVHTTADLEYGDSGAALLNEDDQIVGFAFQRTPFGSRAPMEFASWIWAASALRDLSLTLTDV